MLYVNYYFVVNYYVVYQLLCCVSNNMLYVNYYVACQLLCCMSIIILFVNYLYILLYHVWILALDMLFIPYPMQGPIGSKIPFTPKGGRFCKENFLRHLDLCYVNPAYP